MSGQTSFKKNFQPQQICILRLSAIGDVCHAVAMVQHLQRSLPQSEITWVVGKIEYALLEGLEGVNFVVFDKKAGLQGFKALRSALKGKHFDVLLHMQGALRASLASLCIRAKKRIGFDRARAIDGQWLFTNKQIKPQQHPHVLEGFYAFANALGVAPEPPSWRMPLQATEELWAAETLGADKPVAVIAPSASKAERNWTLSGYAQAAQYLEQKGFKVVLCGGPAKHEILLAEQIIHASKADIVSLVGKTSLKRLLAVLKQAYLVIAPDTGPAHMAVTVGTPVIGLYAHSDPRRTGPYLYPEYVVSCYEQIIELQQNKPLSEVPWGTRAKGEDLMANIQLSKVQEKIDLIVEHHYPQLL
jgi:heptosyltransferase I